jgi:hypothetical protein
MIAPGAASEFARARSGAATRGLAVRRDEKGGMSDLDAAIE